MDHHQDDNAQEQPLQPTTTSNVPPQLRIPPLVSRPKPPTHLETELGANPQLGDFTNVHALSVSEARAVIKAIYAHRSTQPPEKNPLGPGRIHNDSQAINQFVDYLELFSRYRDLESVQALSAILDAHGELTSVEKAMLGSLACDSADEAKTLVPSLAGKMSDETLEVILAEMAKQQETGN